MDPKELNVRSLGGHLSSRSKGPAHEDFAGGELDPTDQQDVLFLLRKIQSKEALLHQEIRRITEREKGHLQRAERFEKIAREFSGLKPVIQDRDRQIAFLNQVHEKLSESNHRAQVEILRLQENLRVLRSYAEQVGKQYEALRVKANASVRRHKEENRALQNKLKESQNAHQKCYKFAETQLVKVTDLEIKLGASEAARTGAETTLKKVHESFVAAQEKQTRALQEKDAQLLDGQAALNEAKEELRRKKQGAQILTNDLSHLKQNASNCREKINAATRGIREVHRSLRGFFDSNPEQMNPLFRDKVGKLLVEQLNLELEKLDGIEGALLGPPLKENP